MKPLLLAAALLAGTAASTNYTISLSVLPATGVILPAAIPQPSAPGDVVGMILQGRGTHYVTFGQGFAKGALLASDTLMARVGAATYPVQIDAHARWSDGSIKHASLTVVVPLAGDTPVMLTKATWTLGAPVALTPRLTVAFSGDLTQAIDLGPALAASPNVWMSGSLAVERWADVPVQGNLHVVAHWRQYADGSVVADVEFDNDLTQTVGEMRAVDSTFTSQRPMPSPLHYDAVITVNGVTTGVADVVQYQYQDWHQVVRTDPAPVNVQEDSPYLARAGLIPSYGFGTGVAQTTFNGFVLNVLSAPKFGVPLGTNGVTPYMPTTGGRPDIGPTTGYDTIWLLTMRPEAAIVGRAQGDAAGSIPWNMWRGGRWINNEAVPTLQVLRQDGNSIAYSIALPPWDAATVPPWAPGATSSDEWATDQGHQPNLAYVPYLLTGDHWYWRRLAAQAAWNTVQPWIGNRCANPQCDAITWLRQGRESAWEMREVGLAAAIGPAGDPDQTYFARVAKDNWDFLIAREPTMWASSTASATARGWLLQGGLTGRISPWQQAYFAIVAAWLARISDTDGPAAWLDYHRTWLAQSFLNTEPGWNPLLGCSAYLKVATSDMAGWYPTWATIAADPVTQANIPASIAACYTQEVTAGLASVLAVRPADPDLRAAYDWLKRQAAIPDATWQATPTWHILPPQE